jgi:hypothetical protein
MKRPGFRHRFGLLFRSVFGEAPLILPALQHAHRLMAMRDYQGAATAFEDLARRAERQGGPRAPFFFLQAGHAHIQRGKFATGVTHFKHGLTLLAAARRYSLLYHAGAHIVRELNARGLEKEAQEVSALIQSHRPAMAEMPTERLPATKPVLPIVCPACGGPLRSDELDWIDERTAECPFCGSPVRAEQ